MGFEKRMSFDPQGKLIGVDGGEVDYSEKKERGWERGREFQRGDSREGKEWRVEREDNGERYSGNLKKSSDLEFFEGRGGRGEDGGNI